MKATLLLLTVALCSRTALSAENVLRLPEDSVDSSMLSRKICHSATLDESLLPSHSNGKRLIFIGDVHGCIDELKLLLDETKYDPKTDHVVFVGDLVHKGVCHFLSAYSLLKHVHRPALK